MKVVRAESPETYSIQKFPQTCALAFPKTRSGRDPKRKAILAFTLTPVSSTGQGLRERRPTLLSNQKAPVGYGYRGLRLKLGSLFV